MATVNSTGSSAASSNIVGLLGAGSGIDIRSLAQKLVAAEQQPREAAINEKINRSEVRISGYGALRSALKDLQTAFESVADPSDFASLNVSNSQPTAFSVITGPNAPTGTFDLQVTTVAQAQRSVATFASRTTTLNNGAGFDLTLTVGSGATAKTHTIAVTTPTPGGVMSAINGAGIVGFNAQLVETGTDVRVFVTGPEGTANGYSLTAAGNAATFTTTQSAGDASFRLNGVTITRPSNTVTDVLKGITFKLFNETSGTARLDLTRDTSGVLDRMKSLVNAYNEFQESIEVLGDRASKVETFGGALAGDSLLRNVSALVRRFITDDSKSPGVKVIAPRDAGLSIDRNGKLMLDEAKLTSQLQLRFDEVVTMFTAGTDNKSVYGSDPAGSAGEAVRRIAAMLRPDGLFDQQTRIVNRQVEDYQSQLTKLQDQMQQLLQRYVQQFAAMDSIVGEATNTRASIKSTFEAMNASKD
jgi:flagellar hook-associated protein 2